MLNTGRLANDQLAKTYIRCQQTRPKTFWMVCQLTISNDLSKIIVRRTIMFACPKHAFQAITMCWRVGAISNFWRVGNIGELTKKR